MRRHYLLLPGALVLFLSACSQQEPFAIDEGTETTARFTVNLPKDYSTRALGDGLSATNLSILVYETGDTENTFVLSGNTTFAPDAYTTTVDLNLVTGKNYLIVFFAQSPDSENVYTINKSSGVLNVEYNNMTSAANIADAYDCFYGTYATGEVGNTNLNTTINLNRPVAQINWGTTEISSTALSNFEDEFGTNGQYLQTTFSASVYTTLNLQTGVYGNQAPVKLTNFSAPASSDGTYPVSGYEYLAVQYVLAPATASATYDLELSVNNNGGGNTAGTISKKFPVSNAPLQANYQTNIYGALLTANAAVTVSKQEGKWTGSYNQTLVWDGTSVTYPTVDSRNMSVAVDRPSDLAGLADMVSGTNGQTANDFAGYTIVLASDFDMGGNTFPSIGQATRSSSSLSSGSTSFKGVFDGQGHTIKNVVVKGTTNAEDAIGIFASVDGSDAVVKDITFSNLVVNAPSNHQAAVVGILSNGATVSNVKVTSGTVTAEEGAAGIVGRVLATGTVTNCSNNATINSGTNGGGIIGAAYYTTEGTTMTVSGCSNTGSVTGTSQGIGGIVGLSAAEISNCTNVGTITGGTTATGGIVGQQNCAGNITNCVNNGKVIGGSGYGSGGIVGWVRYNGTTTAYARQNIISVTSCTNTAIITGSTGVGGIVGVWYMAGICNQNTNTATSISASQQFVAGIVGTSQWTESGPGTPVTGNTNMLYVENNYSSTPLSAITGGASAQYIYVNNSENVTQNGNSDTDPGVVKN